jgi:MFS family permease
MPGCISGAWVSDWLGPRAALTLGVTLQAIVGFIMAGCYAYLSQPHYVGAFVVIYGLFLALGEVGPGDNIGLIASKTSATAVRGQYYGIAGAMGKVGAFVGTYLFPIMQNRYESGSVRAGQVPFVVASALALFSGLLSWFCLPSIGQDMIDEEDRRFRKYLERHGYDISKMGVEEGVGSPVSVDRGHVVDPEKVGGKG